MRYYTPEELAAELEARRCHFVGAGPNGYAFWTSPVGEPFSVPPPGEVVAGQRLYTESLLKDMIAELDLPPKDRGQG